MIDLTCQLYQSQILLVRVSVIFYLKCVRKMSVSIFQYLEQCHHNCAERGREEIFFLELLFEMWISIVSIVVTKYFTKTVFKWWFVWIFWQKTLFMMRCDQPESAGETIILNSAPAGLLMPIFFASFTILNQNHFRIKSVSEASELRSRRTIFVTFRENYLCVRAIR